MSTRYFILGERRRMVEVFDPEAWSQWMADNDTVLRLTEFESLGISVLTRFDGTATPDGSKSPFSTSVIEGREQSAAVPSGTYSEALRQHDRMVDRLLVAASTRSRS